MSGVLTGRCILVVEDEFIIALDVVRTLKAAGAQVLGPAASVEKALAMLEGQRLDGAVLDVNLKGVMVWPVLDALLARGVPMLLATGYNPATIPSDYAGIPRRTKPIAMQNLAECMARQISEAAQASGAQSELR